MDEPHQPQTRPAAPTAKRRPGHGIHERPHPPVRQTPVTSSVASAWEHPKVLAVLLLTLLALPVLALTANHTGSTDSGFEVRTAAAEGQHPTASTTAPAPPTSSSTTAAPATTVPATTPQTTAPAPTAPPTTAPAWTPPPSTAPPATTAPPTTAAPAPGNRESGLATYYAHNPSGCASRTVPRGTTVTVTAASGASITCTVDDFGPFGAGRIIDLSEQGFSRLASLGTGVVSVTVTW